MTTRRSVLRGTAAAGALTALGGSFRKAFADTTPPGFSVEGLAKIPTALQGFVDSGDFSGFVTAIWRKGLLVQFNTIGLRNVEQKLPMTHDTLFSVASMTKPLTATALLILMEEGKIKLDDPLSKWMPEFANMRVLKDPLGPIDDTYPSPRPITVDDIMTHRAGLAGGPDASGPIAAEFQRVTGKVSSMNYTPDEWLKRLASLPLAFPPGQRFAYGNSAEVQGFLAGRVAGTTFRDFVVERICGPLKMPDSDFCVPPAKRDRLAPIYFRSPKTDKLQAIPFPVPDTPPAFAAGGEGLISSADDYLRFERMLLNKGSLDGVRILRPESVTLMTTNRLTPAQSEYPFRNRPFWKTNGYGLGVSMTMVDPSEPGQGSKGSFTWPGAFGTWWLVDPVQDMAMLYLVGSFAQVAASGQSGPPQPQRASAQTALPTFRRLAYEALQN